jgi:hypothetical protein
MIAVLLTAVAISASFDWRDRGVVTPIRSQLVTSGSVTVDSNTCWAHAAVAALETDYLLSTGGSGNLDLSEEYIRDTLPATNDLMVDALEQVTTIGTVTESACALVGDSNQNTPPKLTAPHTLYRAASFTQIPDDLAALKAFISAHGLIVTEITNSIDARKWNTATGQDLGESWMPAWSIFGSHAVFDKVHNFSYIEWHPELSPPQHWDMGYPFQWHVLNLVAWYNNSAWAGGGYFVAKSSYPTSVGPWQDDGIDGFGYISYASMTDPGTMGTTSLGGDRRFYGLDGPAGSLSYSADGAVTVAGSFRANANDIPPGASLAVGNPAYFAPTIDPVSEPGSILLLLLAAGIEMGRRL